MASTKTRGGKAEQLWHDAHSLRDAVDQSGLDCYGKATTGRITLGEALAKYGEAVVRRAVSDGLVYPTRAETRAAWVSGDGASGMIYPSPVGLVDARRVGDRLWTVRLDLADARPDDRLQANGQQVG